MTFRMILPKLSGPSSPSKDARSSVSSSLRRSYQVVLSHRDKRPQMDEKSPEPHKGPETWLLFPFGLRTPHCYPLSSECRWNRQQRPPSSPCTLSSGRERDLPKLSDNNTVLTPSPLLVPLAPNYLTLLLTWWACFASLPISTTFTRGTHPFPTNQKQCS